MIGWVKSGNNQGHSGDLGNNILNLDKRKVGICNKAVYNCDPV